MYNIEYGDSMSGVNGEECLVIIEKKGILPTIERDDTRIEISVGDDSLKVYKAKVCKEEGCRGDIWCLKEISYLDLLERRSEKRISMSIKAEYCFLHDKGKTETMETGLLLNISNTGVFLSTRKPLAMGSIIVMMFDVNWDNIDVPVGVVGTVIREQEDIGKLYPKAYTYGYGVKFNSPRGKEVKRTYFR